MRGSVTQRPPEPIRDAAVAVVRAPGARLGGRVIQWYEDSLRRRGIFPRMNRLMESQFQSREVLIEMQLAALRRLLAHAYQQCPYYRRRWAELGLHPGDVQSLSDFERWPIIDRPLVRQHAPHMCSDLHRGRLQKKATGGSSGEPLLFFQDWPACFGRVAAAFRGYSWAGAPPGSRQWHLWGVPLGTSSWRLWKERLHRRYIYRHTLANCFSLRRENAPLFADQLARARPHAIVAYAGALFEFARLLREESRVPYRPSTIVVGAEKLHAFQRSLIEEVFQAPVFETYGCREFGLVAAECDHRNGLHVTMEDMMVEVVDDQGNPVPPEHEGNLVVTDLRNYGMPFIRYANGDRGRYARQECPCGRGLALLREVTGRQLDVLTLPGGRILPGEFFPHLFKDCPGVDRFQVIQHDISHLELRIQSRGLTPREKSFIVTQTQHACGPETSIELAEVSEIPLSVHGKRRVVINLCGTGGEAAGKAAAREAITPPQTEGTSQERSDWRLRCQ